MDLSVVIVNWNSTALAATCIATLVSTIQGLDFEIIVVDNASPDRLSHTLQQISPRVKVLFAGENLGFSRANNIGAAQSTGETILFLNPDTEVYSGAVNALHQVLNQTDQAGIAGGRLLNSDLTVQTSCIQSFPTLLNQAADIERVRRMFPRWSGIAPLLRPSREAAAVEAVSGACLMIKRAVFDAVGGFDSTYFMYAEDIDLCYRVQQRGFDVLHVGAATVLHHGGQSSHGQTQSAFSAVLTRESMHKFFRRHRGASCATAYRVSTAFSAAARLLVSGGMARRNKWWKILRWSLGLEPWAEMAGRAAVRESILVSN